MAETTRDILIQTDRADEAGVFYAEALGFRLVQDDPHMRGFETGAFPLCDKSASSWSRSRLTGRGSAARGHRHFSGLPVLAPAPKVVQRWRLGATSLRRPTERLSVVRCNGREAQRL